MTVIPKAYQYVPGDLTGAAHIAGIRAMLGVSLYWQEVSFSSNLLTISSRVGFPYVILVTQQSSSLLVSFSHDGSLFSTASSVTFTSTFNSTNVGSGSDFGWIVETEDSLSWFSRSNFSGTVGTPTGIYAKALGFCFSVGRIFTPDNRSDDSSNVGVFGALVGHASAYTAAANGLWTLNPGAGNSRILLGTAYETIEIQRSFVRGRSFTSPSVFPFPDGEYTAPMGDGDDIDRLAPIRVVGSVSGTVANTRYIRARHYSVGDTDASGLIESDTVRPSAGDPNIAWRHSAYSSLTSGGSQSSPQNTIYLWSPTTTILTI